MYTATTKDITIKVTPRFEAKHSDVENDHFVFSYMVDITNGGSCFVQLLSRTWIIFDSKGIKRSVEGEGVIGQQPIIKIGETFSYTSWCPLTTDMGYMKGSYTMLDLEANRAFEVQIPRFQLISLSRNN